MRIFPRADWPFKLIEEPGVTEAIVASRAKYQRFDEAWEGLSWLIAHGGDRLGVVERKFGGVGHYVYTYEGDGVAGFPRIVVVYRWGLGKYTLRMIVVSDPP